MNVRWMRLGTVVLLLTAGALPAALAVPSNVGLNNKPPVITSVSLAAGSVNPTAGATTSIAVTVAATDANGYNDLSSVSVQVLKPDGTTVHVASAAATFSSGNGAQGTYSYSFNMNYYDDPALTTDSYKIVVTATDRKGSSVSNSASPQTFNYAELAAVSLGSSTLDLGSSLTPGSTTAVASMSVLNRGNVRIDAQASGGSLTHATQSASIPVSNLRYGTASDMSGSAALTGSAATLGNFDLAKGSGSSKSLYWQLSVPSGTDQWIPAGTYTGTFTMAAVKG